MVWISFDEYTFQHPWEKVVEAALRKYPNPETPNVTSTDVAERSIDEEGKLHSTRIISSVWAGSTMKYVAKLTGLSGLLKTIHAVEYSTVDIQNKKYELTSRNHNFMDYITIDEKLTYTAHHENSQLTTLKQEWIIKVKNLSFTSFLENVMGSTMQGMAHKGRKGIEHVIHQLRDEVDRLSTSVESMTSSLDSELDQLKEEFINKTAEQVTSSHQATHSS